MKVSVVNGGGGGAGEKVAVEPARPTVKPARSRSGGRRRPRSPRPDRRLPLHGALAHARRQGNPAQESEPHLLPDQRRRTRSDPRRGRPRPASRATTGSTPTTAIARWRCSSASRRSRCCSPRSARRPIRATADGRCRRTGAIARLNIVSGSSATPRSCCRRSAARKPA